MEGKLNGSSKENMKIENTVVTFRYENQIFKTTTSINVYTKDTQTTYRDTWALTNDYQIWNTWHLLNVKYIHHLIFCEAFVQLKIYVSANVMHLDKPMYR